jgi:hypothetical protein
MNNENIEPLAPQPGDEATPQAAGEAAPKILCANCGAELLGQTCYSCGQPVKGMVRHLSSILADVADTILNIDSRIFRTLWPLLLKPGFLTNEYLAGRRVRYVTPFRLYFFLSVIAFLVIAISLDATLDLKDTIRADAAESLSTLHSATGVEAHRDEAIAALDKAKSAPELNAKAIRGIEKAQEQIRARADKRLKYLQLVEEAKAKGAPPPPDVDAEKDKDEDFNFEIGGKHWDPRATPIRIDWLPGFVNAKLNVLATHTMDNVPRIRKDPKPFLIGAFSSLPQVLFILMPIFAMLLKVFYIFKRRLYMEHLIVALHSHSFIFLSLLLLTLVGLVRGWANTGAPWLAGLLGLAMFVLGWWLPIYLLIMQKRVYKQGWFLTVIKYLTIGLCYTILITFGVVIAFAISVATI